MSCGRDGGGIEGDGEASSGGFGVSIGGVCLGGGIRGIVMRVVVWYSHMLCCRGIDIVIGERGL